MNITSDKKGAELEAEVDTSIAKFEIWFRNHIDTEPLSKGEKAIIKTYLGYHLIPDAATRMNPEAKKKAG